MTLANPSTRVDFGWCSTDWDSISNGCLWGLRTACKSSTMGKQGENEAQPMAVEYNGFIELYDLTKKTVVSQLPLARIRFLPRVGERILISATGAGDWESFK